MIDVLKKSAQIGGEVLKKYFLQEELDISHKTSHQIIVGFCGETEEEFQSTVDLAKRVGYDKAYISIYSERPMTAATKVLTDDVPHVIKKKRWQILEDIINKKYHKSASFA